MNPAPIASLADYESAARQCLAPDVYAHVAGGSGDKSACRRNTAAFDRHCVYPRVLADVRSGTTATTLLGEAFRHPVLLAPVSHQRLVHVDGELATAQAAAALETGMVLSTLASTALEDVAAALPANRWFQLYFQPGRAATERLVRRAEQAGYGALVVTVDAPVSAMRYRGERAGFQMPQHITTPNVEPDAAERTTLPDSASRVLQGVMTQAPIWDDLTWLVRQTRLPVVLKGVMHRDDIRRAADSGCQGVVLSNHGGRALDQAPAPLQALPLVRADMGPDFLVLVDGSVRSGGDVFVALALGADAVLIGRPQLYALAVGGAAGVARMLRIIRDELEVTMALAGCATLDDIGPHCLVPDARAP